MATLTKEELIAEKRLYENSTYGEWIGHEENGDYWVECSKCHSNHGLATNFCPDCGIKMKNEEEQMKPLTKEEAIEIISNIDKA